MTIQILTFPNIVISTKNVYSFVYTSKEANLMNTVIDILFRHMLAKFYRVCYQNFINDLTKLVSSQSLAHVQLRVCLKYKLIVLLLPKIIEQNIMKKILQGKE